MTLRTRLFLLFSPDDHQSKENQSDSAASTKHPGIQTVSHHQPNTDSKQQATLQMCPSAHKNTPCKAYAGGIYVFTRRP